MWRGTLDEPAVGRQISSTRFEVTAVRMGETLSVCCPVMCPQPRDQSRSQSDRSPALLGNHVGAVTFPSRFRVPAMRDAWQIDERPQSNPPNQLGECVAAAARERRRLHEERVTGTEPALSVWEW